MIMILTLHFSGLSGRFDYNKNGLYYHATHRRSVLCYYNQRIRTACYCIDTLNISFRVKGSVKHQFIPDEVMYENN